MIESGVLTDVNVSVLVYFLYCEPLNCHMRVEFCEMVQMRNSQKFPVTEIQGF